MVRNKLTDKQAAFVSEYLVDACATQAAIRAGYSVKSARYLGAELIATPKVRAAIDELRQDRSAKLSVDAAWVLARLKLEADADLAALFDEETGCLKPVHSWPMQFRQGIVSGLEVEEIFSGSGESRKHIGRLHKVRLEHRGRRLELIGKHVSVLAFKDQIAVTGLDDLAARLARAKQR